MTENFKIKFYMPNKPENLAKIGRLHCRLIGLEGIVKTGSTFVSYVTPHYIAGKLHARRFT